MLGTLYTKAVSLHSRVLSQLASSFAMTIKTDD